MASTDKTVYCPANCDKPFTAKTRTAAMVKLRAHVKKAHPDYDPKWEEEI